jgi:hypothetical protein
MVTTVENPFDTQQPNATNTGIIGGQVQNMDTGTAATQNYQQYNPLPNLQPQTYTAQTREVNAPTDTAVGQVNSILAKDSPLMQRARTLATQQMAQRGLVNSSMNQGAGVAAMIDRATPLAQQDAQIYSQRAQANMDATNQAGMFNTGQTNQMFQFGQDVASRFGLQKEAQQFQTGERLGAQEFTAGQNQIQLAFNEKMALLQESGMDFRQARDIASREAIVQLEQAGVMNRFDQELALKSEMFNIEQLNAERRQIIQNDFELQKLGIQINANNQSIPTAFAANISNTTMSGVNAILADGNLTPEAKQGAIDNLVKYANAQISWASAFYSTAIPPISAPR